MKNEECELLSISSAARFLGIAQDTLYDYAKTGFLPAFKMGNRWKFSRTLLMEWIAQQSGAVKSA